MGRWGPERGAGWTRSPEERLDVVRTVLLLLLYGVVTGWVRTHATVLELAWPAAGLAALWLAGSWGRPRRLARDAVLVVLTTVVTYLAVGYPAARGMAVGVVAVLSGLVTVATLDRLVGGRCRVAEDLTVRRTSELVAVLAAALAGGLVPALVAPGLLRAVVDEDIPLVMQEWWLRSSAATFVLLAVGLRLRTRVLPALSRLVDRGAGGAGLHELADAPGGPAPEAAPRSRPVEALAVGSVLAGCYAVATAQQDPTVLVVTLLPLAVWAGLRLTTDHVVLLVLANAVGLLFLADATTGPSLRVLTEREVLMTQVVVVVVSFCVLVLALHRDAQSGLAVRERCTRRAAQQQARLLEAVVASAREGVFVLDAADRVVLDNAAARAMLGMPHEASRAVRVASYTMHLPDGTPLGEGEKPGAAALAGVTSDGQLVLVRRADGGESWVEVSARPLPGPDGTGAVVTLVDVTDRRRSARVNAERERLFRLALDASPLGLLVLPLTPGDRKVARSNPAMARLLGRTDLDGCDVADLAEPTDMPLLHAALDAMADGVDVERFEVRLLGPGGRRVRCACTASVVAAGDGAPEAVLLVEDVTERHEIEVLLAHQASHDALTGLPNRALLLDRLDDLLRPGPAADSRVGVLYLDLDGFKAVNDAEGHAVGDDVLRAVAGRLDAAVRPGDTVARLGGDELVVVCPGLSVPADLDVVAARVVAAVGAPYDPPARLHRITASLGTALAAGGEDAATVLARADAAMYAAKRAGGDRWCAAPRAPREGPTPLGGDRVDDEAWRPEVSTAC
ncbi:diguanylate cyclase domain-containing protein [Pseudokineococcus sp. 1T1Z-3]|uniref:diguanylate cyclase domain-containing protein n=1 Tax=Pseudokineococcus sp. 1T1Z-3 TaxID=3132745 RepID=UPI0030ACA382